jgi:hypothetical protein
MAMVIVAACLIAGLLTITVGAGLMTDFIGGIARAFGNSITHLTSQAPATAPPSGSVLDTPVLDTPPNGGYTNESSVTIQGSVPAASVGKTGYTVHVYLLGKNDAQSEVANVAVGGTTRFSTPQIKLTEGTNAFMATLATPAGEGQPSPVVNYILDTAPPKIAVSSPAGGAGVSTSSVDVSGTCDAGAMLTIRNEQVTGGALNSQVVGADGRFTLTIPVVAGPNKLDLTATDQAGNTSSMSLTVNRAYGQLKAYLSVTPSRFAAKSQTRLTLTLHATSIAGGPLANAKVTFTVTIQGLGPIVSPELTTDVTGVATWQVDISGASPGSGAASVLVTSPAGDQATATTAIATT